MTTNLETTFVPLTGFEQRAEGDRHVIEGICVPYGVVTHKVGPTPEVFDRGAFAGLVESGARVKLTDYNHARNRVPVGYSSVFEDRAAGLWARFRLNATPEGESARANASEGVYGGLSVGFIPRADRIENGVRHVTSARLDHVSLVEDPAYADAVILDVRGADQWADLRRLIADPPKVTIDLGARPLQTVSMTILRRRTENRNP